MVSGPSGAPGMLAPGLVEVARKSRHGAAQIPHQGGVERNAGATTSKQRAVTVLTVERTGLLGQNGVNVARLARQEIK